MRFHQPLSYILDNRIKVDILRFLLKTAAEWSGREIAKELKISPAACHKALKSLYYEGIVFLRAVSHTHLYRLNQQHLITQNFLKPLFQQELQGVNNLISLINLKVKRVDAGIISLALFGSILAGKEKPHSDIDLLVIVKRETDKPKTEKLLSELDSLLTVKTGNILSPYIQTVEEFRRKHKRGLSVIKNIINSHLLIRGKPVRDLL